MSQPAIPPTVDPPAVDPSTTIAGWVVLDADGNVIDAGHDTTDQAEQAAADWRQQIWPDHAATRTSLGFPCDEDWCAGRGWIAISDDDEIECPACTDGTGFLIVDVQPERDDVMQAAA